MTKIYPLLSIALLPLSVGAADTFVWTDSAGNNNWISSSNWNQNPGAGDYPGENSPNPGDHQSDNIELKGSKWGSGGTNHFDIDLTTSSSATNFRIATLNISTDGSTDNWLIQDGPQQGRLTLYADLITNLNGNGNASMDGDLYLSSSQTSSIDWTTSGNKLVLNGTLLGDANADLWSTDASNGGGITLKSASDFAGGIYLKNNTLDIDHVNAMHNAEVMIGTGGVLEYVANTNIAKIRSFGTGSLALAGNLNVGGNNDSFGFSGNLSGSGDLTKKGTGTLQLSGTSSHSGRTTIDAGEIKLGNGTALNNSLVWLNVQNGLNINGNNATIGGLGGGGNFNLGSNTLTISGDGVYQHLGVISGTGALTIDMAGSQEFGSNNTYSGGTILTGGTLICSAEGDLGNTSGALILGNASFRANATQTQTRNLLFAFNITNTTFQVDNGKTLTWSGLINEGTLQHTIEKTGVGDLVFTNDSNLYYGPLVVSGGTVTPSATSLASTRVELNTDNGLTLTGVTKTIGSLHGSGALFMASDLNIGLHQNTATYSGHISRQGVNTLTKTNGGTQIFSGTSERIGETVINGGKIVIGNLTQTPIGTGLVTVNSGGTLSGNGIVGGSVAVRSGGSVTTLSNAATLTMQSLNLGGAYECEVTDGGASKLVCNFALTLTNGTLNLSFPSGAPSQPAYVLMTYGSTLIGEFASVQNLPIGYTIDYAYNDGSTSKNVALVADTTPPTVSITTTQNNPTNANSISYTVTFNEPITGLVDASDFYITGTTVANTDIAATTVVNSGDDQTFTITLNNISGDGFLQFRLKANQIADGAGNFMVSDPFSPGRTIDNTAPVITLVGSASITQTEGGGWSDPGSGATDNIDASLTVTLGGDTVLPSTPGSYTITYDATDAAGNVADQVSRTVQIVSYFTAWGSDKGLTPGVDDGPMDNPDGDSLNNLAEFALDSDPMRGANGGKVVGKLATVSTVEYLTLTLPVRTGAVFAGTPSPSASLDGLTYTIEASSDLSAWTQGSFEVTPALTSGMPALSTGWEYRTFRYQQSTGATAKSFMRIQITEVP